MSNVDYALIVHIWHLDVCHELALAVRNIPHAADQYITAPISFGPAEISKIKCNFPRATIVRVENAGQDIGALFSLMDQVDLGRYSFICKIHTKKGYNMPEKWRQTLLRGVLPSRSRALEIVQEFRCNPEVMLGGSRELYLHGPSYVGPNKPIIDDLVTRAGYDLTSISSDWGFVAGTCFWARVNILKKIHSLGLKFHTSQYSYDGTLAHAVERLFGLVVRLEGGSVILTNCSERSFNLSVEKFFPCDTSRSWRPIAEVLSLIPTIDSHSLMRQRTCDILSRIRWLAMVFASYLRHKRHRIFQVYCDFLNDKRDRSLSHRGADIPMSKNQSNELFGGDNLGDRMVKIPEVGSCSANHEWVGKVIERDLRLLEYSSEVMRLRVELDDLKSSHMGEIEKIHEIYKSSTSWRITKPLRFITNLYRFYFRR